MVEGSVSLNETKMDYVSFGRGEKALVIIPGLSLNRVKGFGASLWYMYRKFTKEYTVYVFDRKDDIADGYTIEMMSDELAFAMRSLDIKDAYVVGISQGGMIAQYLAIHHPQLVCKVVLGVTCCRKNDKLENAISDWITLMSKDMNLFIKDMLTRMYSKGYVKKFSWVFLFLGLFYKNVDQKRFEILAKACLTCDCYDDLDNISCPVLVLGGMQDEVIGKEGSLEIIERLGCSYYMYEDLGHSAYDEAKDFNDRIYHFFR